MLVHFNSIQQIYNQILEVRDLCKDWETQRDKTTGWGPGRMSQKVRKQKAGLALLLRKLLLSLCFLFIPLLRLELNLGCE